MQLAINDGLATLPQHKRAEAPTPIDALLDGG